jgi:hypothetical protein
MVVVVVAANIIGPTCGQHEQRHIALGTVRIGELGFPHRFIVRMLLEKADHFLQHFGVFLHGWLEHSAVNPVQEMVELIAASRSYETNIRLIQQHDGMTSSLVSRMLRA